MFSTMSFKINIIILCINITASGARILLRAKNWTLFCPHYNTKFLKCNSFFFIRSPKTNENWHLNFRSPLCPPTHRILYLAPIWKWNSTMFCRIKKCIFPMSAPIVMCVKQVLNFNIFQIYCIHLFLLSTFGTFVTSSIFFSVICVNCLSSSSFHHLLCVIMKKFIFLIFFLFV